MLDGSMNLFDIILIQPIFNVLVAIYGLIPGRDFGLALIIFTVIIRLVMWPLVRKQIHQTKIMRELQPKLAEIRKKAKGNRQLEATMMMELYRERGINPYGSIGLILVQLPIFIALFAVVRLITEEQNKIGLFTYDFLEGIPAIKDAIAGNFNETLFGFVDLTKHAVESGGQVYWPLMVMAVAAAVLQYIQSKQLLPEPKEKRRLRDMLKEQATGKEVDQAEMSAIVTNKMIWLFPILTFIVGIYLAGALVLYLVVQSAVAIIQQAVALKSDVPSLQKVGAKTGTRHAAAKPAEVVKEPKASPAKRKRRK